MTFSTESKAKGWSLFEVGKELMPGGNGTLSKVPRLSPDEPAVVRRGKGCRLWDVDGNEYIDFRCALGPVTLGYCHPAVDEAIRRQLSYGIVFGQPNELEFQLAGEQAGQGLTEIFRHHGLPVEFKGLAPCRALAFQAETDSENLRLQRS